MNANWKNRMPWAVAAAVLLLGLIVMARWQPAQAAEGNGAVTGPRYTVVDTEGHNLIVTDNKTNTLYFYTIDRDAKIGSELKLRGKVDLKQVGKKVIGPETISGDK
jgi:hypothetical protein